MAKHQARIDVHVHTENGVTFTRYQGLCECGWAGKARDSGGDRSEGSLWGAAEYDVKQHDRAIYVDFLRAGDFLDYLAMID